MSVMDGIKNRHQLVEVASDKLAVARKQGYLTHLDRGDLLAEIERLTLELQVSSQQAGELRDDRARLRSALGNIASYSLIEDSKAMEWVRNAAKEALHDGEQS